MKENQAVSDGFFFWISAGMLDKIKV